MARRARVGGGEHVVVAARTGRRGVGTQLVAHARDAAQAAGCERLHVDFDDELRNVYVGSCGFRPTNGGLIQP